MTRDEYIKTFVAGAKWWEFHSTKFTMWQSDQELAEKQAAKRFLELPAVEAYEIYDPVCSRCGQALSTDEATCAECRGDAGEFKEIV